MNADITLGNALALAGFLLLWGGAIWRMVQVNAKKEANLYTAIGDVVKDINEVGAKVNKIEGSCAITASELNAVKIQQQKSDDDRSALREKVAMNAASIKDLQSAVQEDRLAVMATLHANERAAAERDAKTREELARISERLDIERMVASVVRAVSGSNFNNKG